MSAQKKIIETKKRDLELLAGGGGVERVRPRRWLSVIFGFLFAKKSDLTLEAWQELERKRGIVKSEPTAFRDQYPHNHWRI